MVLLLMIKLIDLLSLQQGKSLIIFFEEMIKLINYVNYKVDSSKSNNNDK